MIQDKHSMFNIRMWQLIFLETLLIFHFRSVVSRIWAFVFKVALIVGVFFIVKKFLSGGNTPGGVRPMSAGPDHRPPGNFVSFFKIFY